MNNQQSPWAEPEIPGWDEIEAMLDAMPDLEPAPDFTARVMERVNDLPLPQPIHQLKFKHRLDWLRTFLTGSLIVTLGGVTTAYFAPQQFWGAVAAIWYGLQAAGGAALGLWRSGGYLLDGLTGWAWKTPVLALCAVCGLLALEWQILHQTAGRGLADVE